MSPKKITLLNRTKIVFSLVMGWPWLAARCPPSHSLTLPPHQNGGRN